MTILEIGMPLASYLLEQQAVRESKWRPIGFPIRIRVGLGKHFLDKRLLDDRGILLNGFTNNLKQRIQNQTVKPCLGAEWQN